MDIKLSDAIARYLTALEGNCADGTKINASLYTSYALKYWGDIPLSDITLDSVIDWQSWLVNRKRIKTPDVALSRGFVRHVRQKVSALFDFCLSVAALMGHACVTTTLGTYGHLFHRYSQAASDCVDYALLGGNVHMFMRHTRR